MENTKLELRHLAPYLPYGLKVEFKSETYKNPELVGIVRCTVWLNYHGTALQTLVEKTKPILRPLSDLTKEIEVNGETFIPIMVLFGGVQYRDYDFTIDIIERPLLGKRIDISVKDVGSPCISFGLKEVSRNPLMYNSWEELFSWHFDVFGLIEKGLAIDINTLKP